MLRVIGRCSPPSGDGPSTTAAGPRHACSPHHGMVPTGRPPPRSGRAAPRTRGDGPKGIVGVWNKVACSPHPTGMIPAFPAAAPSSAFYSPHPQGLSRRSPAYHADDGVLPARAGSNTAEHSADRVLPERAGMGTSPSSPLRRRGGAPTSAATTRAARTSRHSAHGRIRSHAASMRPRPPHAPPGVMTGQCPRAADVAHPGPAAAPPRVAGEQLVDRRVVRAGIIRVPVHRDFLP